MVSCWKIPLYQFPYLPCLASLSPNSILGNHLPDKLLALGYLSWGLLLGETQLRQPAWLINHRFKGSLLWHQEDPQKDSCLLVDLIKVSFHYILRLTALEMHNLYQSSLLTCTCNKTESVNTCNEPKAAISSCFHGSQTLMLGFSAVRTSRCFSAARVSESELPEPCDSP